MNKKCFIDRNIELTKREIEFIESLNLAVSIIDENKVDYSEIEYLLLHSKLSDEHLLAMRNCKYIGIRAHNTDYVSDQITSQQGVVVKGLQNQHGINAVAEHTFSLIFSLIKNTVNAHKNVIAGKWRENLRLNDELSNKKLGIIGNGKIGHRVAEIATFFGMEILLAGKKNEEKPGEMILEDVLKNADIVTLHLSSQEENNNYINHDRLKLMKKNSILINTARGSVLDYLALEKEIKNDKFLGVGLDVFNDEPVLHSSLTQYSNVILTPHIAYMTNETLDKMNNELLENLKAFVNQEMTASIANL